MEVSFLDLKEREVINVYDGKKLGRIIDVVFNNKNGVVKGIIVPGDKKIFRKAEDIFIPIDKIKRIGNDVILVGLQFEEPYKYERFSKSTDKNIRSYENYYDTFMGNSYYPPRPSNTYNKPTKIYRAEEKNCQVENNKPLVSYVRLKPLERKKYK